MSECFIEYCSYIRIHLPGVIYLHQYSIVGIKIYHVVQQLPASPIRCLPHKNIVIQLSVTVRSMFKLGREVSSYKYLPNDKLRIKWY